MTREYNCSGCGKNFTEHEVESYDWDLVFECWIACCPDCGLYVNTRQDGSIIEDPDNW